MSPDTNHPGRVPAAPGDLRMMSVRALLHGPRQQGPEETQQVNFVVGLKENET